MSLIQEALKRKRSEHDAQLSILPDPEQVARQLEKQVQRIKQQALQDILVEQQAQRSIPRKKRNLVVGTLGLLGIIGVVVGSMLAGGYLITRNSDVAAWNQKLHVTTEQHATETTEPITGVSSSIPEKTVTAPGEGRATVASTAPALPALKSAPAVPQGPSENKPATEQRWPELTIVGVMARANSSRSSAVINNRVVFVNQHIQGVQLIEVQDTGVMLEFKGVRRFVEVGQQPGDQVD